MLDHVVVGMGEIGKPLLSILKRRYSVEGHDPRAGYRVHDTCRMLHICLLGEAESFVEIVKDYCTQFQPEALCIHSSVIPGTMSTLDGIVDNIAYSPVFGKHIRMDTEMLHYPKMIATCSHKEYKYFEKELMLCGFKCQWIPDTKAAELGKLLQTSLYGLLIAWTQEAERLSKIMNTDLGLVRRFWTDIESDDFNINNKWPGIIGGHCIIPNLKILRKLGDTPLLNAILDSNELKKADHD